MKIKFQKLSESFKRSSLIALGYGIAYGFGFLAELIDNPKLSASFYVSEQEVISTYTLNLKDYMDIIGLGPIFTIIAFLFIRKIIQGFYQEDSEEKKRFFAYAIFLIGIVMFNYGNFIHVTMNRLNSQIPQELREEVFYYSIYYLDEFVGHMLVTLGFFIVLVEGMLIHTAYLAKKENSSIDENFICKKTESYVNLVYGLLLGIITADTYLEGQCAFIFLILNPLFCVIMLIFSFGKKISIKENSLLMMFIVMTIVFSVWVFIWGLTTGIKPYYPFFYQGSEL